MLGGDPGLAATKAGGIAAGFELAKNFAHECSLKKICHRIAQRWILGKLKKVRLRKCKICEMNFANLRKMKMAGKLYIGRKVRELRLAGVASQSQFAERIGISVSYLNQIENNQRPVSATVLLSLAENFKIDLSGFGAGESERLMSAISEALKDPIFASSSPSKQDLKLVVQNAPAIAHALIAAHRAFRHTSEQLASIDHSIGRGTGLTEETPYEEVRDFFHFMDNYIHVLDLKAERLAREVGIGETENYTVLCRYLKRKHGVQVTRTGRDDNVVRRFDSTSRTLALNPFLATSTRDFQLAIQIAQFEAAGEADAILKEASFKTEEAREICRIGLFNYFAGALLLPYSTFRQTVQEVRHDLELLTARFGASLEQICHRLSTLQRPGEKGTPVFFARIDRAGNISKRHSVAKLQFARFGAACPLWNVHQAFEAPGRIIRQLAETPDGVGYLCLSTQIVKGGRGFHQPRQHYALALGCEISHAHNFVYADNMELGNRAAFDAIGISCRVCERTECGARAIPPINGRLSFDHDQRSILPYHLRS
jgi:predicted transcriptional regulator/transcriptional regulator with XRE-family HTH domain